MKKVLITGGAGFIGSEIIKQMSETNDYDITVLDSMTKQIHGDSWENSYLYRKISEKCSFIKEDIRNFSTIKDIISENEYIVHLAAETGTGQSMYQINQYNEANIMGTSNLLQAISSNGKISKVQKIILSSSRSVYGEGKYKCLHCGVVFPSSRKRERMIHGDFNMYCDICGDKLQVESTTEDSLVSPNSLYAFTKYTQEGMLQTMCSALGIEYTIFRLQNVYGVGQSLKNPYTGILSIFSTFLLENKPINIFEDGLESRDFVNVKDVATAVIKALTEDKSNSEIINLGSGVGTSVIEIAELLKKTYHSQSQINITGDFRIGDIAHNIADISKAESLLDFKQSISLEDGLTAFCQWVLGEDKDNSGYEMSLTEMENAGMFIRKRK
ncbi:MAG TPA: epimerase [Lachnoclostridium sp.]|nr:epimerase [Lachnoclostridium sp.]